MTNPLAPEVAGIEGVPATEEDLRFAAVRYEEYQRLRRENPEVESSVLILQLPLDGGTTMRCGCTRFEHVQLETCRNPDSWNVSCKAPMAKDTTCVLKIDHRSQHMNAPQVARKRAKDKAYKQKRREYDAPIGVGVA